jgi:hypothetical protein
LVEILQLQALVAHCGSPLIQKVLSNLLKFDEEVFHVFSLLPCNIEQVLDNLQSRKISKTGKDLLSYHHGVW